MKLRRDVPFSGSGTSCRPSFLPPLPLSYIFMGLLFTAVIVLARPHSDLIYMKAVQDMKQSLAALDRRGIISNSIDDQDLDLGVSYADPEPEVSPGMFQGDIAGIAGLSPELFVRLGLKWEIFPEKKWINGTVPYVISKKYSPQERLVIENAIASINFFTCVEWVQWDGIQLDYILIWPIEKPSGCWSFVGRNGGQQLLSLQQPTEQSYKCLGSVGKPMHELLHALGVFHEHAREDRDDYITIKFDNIRESHMHNFNKQSLFNTTFSEHPYDYHSIMHYGTHFFGVDRRHPTIVPNEPNADIGQRRMLSKLDCLKVNKLYGCLDGPDPFINNKYQSFCEILAI